MMRLVSSRWAMWLAMIIVGAAGTFVLFAPDFVATDWLSEGTRARLLRDDHEISVFHDRGSWVTQGVTPYDASIFQEYPQIGLGYITLPYIFNGGYDTYRTVFIIMNLAVYLGLVYVTVRLLRRLQRSPWLVLLLALPSLLYFGMNRFDVLVALGVQIGLWLVLSRRWRMAAIVFAIAILTKWYPVIFVPLMYLYIRQTEGVMARSSQRQFLGYGAAVVIGFLALSFVFDGFTSLRPYFFHGARPGGVGSLYYLFVQGPLLSTGIEQLNYLGLTIFLLLQFSLPLVALIQPRVLMRYLATPAQLAGWMALGVLIFTLCSRFYSPQWIIWAVPLIILVADKRLIWLVVVYDILNYASFPLIWQVWGPQSFGYAAISAVIILCTVLIIYTLYLIRMNSSVDDALRVSHQLK